MTTIEFKLPESGRIINIKTVKTYGVSKQYQMILMEGININTDNADMSNVNIPLTNSLKAMDFLITAMSDISEDELNELSERDGTVLTQKVQELSVGLELKKK